MARGFESKDVEFQQAEAVRARALAPTLSHDERDRVTARRTITLTLARARAELAETASPVRRDVLSRAIAALECQLVDTGSA